MSELITDAFLGALVFSQMSIFMLNPYGQYWKRKFMQKSRTKFPYEKLYAEF